MKVILLSVAMMAIALLMSCGEKDGDKEEGKKGEKKGADICECMEQKASEMSAECEALKNEWEQKIESASSNEEKEAVAKEMMDLAAECENK